MIKHYTRIIRDCEKRAGYFIKNQIIDEASENYGGYVEENELIHPKSTIIGATLILSLYYNKESIYYLDEKAYERIIIGLDYARRMQRIDGTFDYIYCNFYASPDTAFCLWSLIPAYRLVELNAQNEKATILKNRIFNLIQRAGYGIAAGGFHTPNHRWAIASTLMALYNITEIEKFKTVAEEYLIEGIDGNEYGEYAERSAGGYNAVNNEALIILGRETGDDTYLEYVNRNLEMMLTYFEPDGSIFTNNSTRQDRGKKVYPGEYYYEYLYMAHKNNNKHFAAVANKIMEDIIDRGLLAPDCLSRLMLMPELIAYETEGMGFLENYKKYYKDSGIIRVKMGDVSYSIIENGTRFLYFQVGALSAYMKIGVPFFEQREYKIQSIKEVQDAYILNYKVKGWYYKPFREKPATSDWWKMDNKSRDMVYIPNLEIILTVKEIEEGITVNICTKGCDRVPLKVELGFNAGGQVKSEGFMCEATAGGAITVVSGNVQVKKDMDAITVGPAFAKHNFAGGNFGSEARSMDHFTTYFTDFSNFDHTITLKKG